MFHLKSKVENLTMLHEEHIHRPMEVLDQFKFAKDLSLQSIQDRAPRGTHIDWQFSPPARISQKNL